MASKKRKALYALLFIFIGIAAFLWLRSYVFSTMGEAISQKFQSLKISGFNVQYDSLHLDWQKNVITIDQLVLKKTASDTTCLYPESITVGRIRAEGFRLIPLLLHKRLSLENVYLDEPHLVMRENSRITVDSTTQRENEFTLTIDRLFLNSARIEYTDSVTCQLTTGFKSYAVLAALEIRVHPDKPFFISANSLALDSTEVRLPKEFYTFQIKQTSINFSKRTLQVDTVRIIPDLGKQEFGRKFGYEIDRFEGVIPFVRLSGFSFSFRDSTVIRSAVADIQFYLKVFRDKRLPFQYKVKRLPIAQLQHLPFTLRIDSLKITKSYVQYEEFVKNAMDPGKIFFDDLSATLYNINNQSLKGNMNLFARASLMGKGDINLLVTFPWDSTKNARLRGTLKNFSIPEINSMLTPSTNIKVESGDMKNLSFGFLFNSVRSDGEIALNYRDLKLVTFKEDDKKTGVLKKDENNEFEKDNLKTFIMNTFIFRKNMDENVPEEKRTGTVMFNRDESRSVFNFWVKSLLSGIKSAYNLDKASAKKIQRDEKKEEKLSKRQMRKQRKADKKG